MIIVTGGAGFIGSNLLAGLEARGHGPLVVVDFLGHGDKWRNIAKRSLADVVAPAALPPLLDRHASNITAIFHMGAISATTETNADLIVATNIRLTLDLWDWCTCHEVPFFYASSAATYGDGREGFDDTFSSPALARLRPLNPYGWSKHMVDRRLCTLVEAGRPTPPRWAGFKFFNVYGPNETHKDSMRSVVHQIHPIARQGEAFALFKSHHPDYADGGQRRDFIWVEDIVQVMLWFLETPAPSGLYNLGTGTARSFADLASAVYRALGQEPRITYRDMPETLRPRYQYFTEARMDKLREAGYRQPFTALEEGVRRYIQDYLEQDDPFR
ncbi:ADP-glyceromanno-heptose 6-epimerase [Pararhodospirillum photometricum]|uniref:ADP-L-glycero-D-manno-heptose-6-epimerase n=1 Tax=Pararhodospirillum photometricum DSM 122 TaxID=1150469 RepID=H6SR05_PARPM|nr:ADP-glyceromanno-heptose 6-epimerase [Pararhodospirillum photometricum]CCG09727.1 ADP-glyceromanno-heptose 6-epimerase [Pararhodospirillum photometricum DSM 122]